MGGEVDGLSFGEHVVGCTASGLEHKRRHTEVGSLAASSSRRLAAASTRNCKRSSFIEVMYSQWQYIRLSVKDTRAIRL